MACEKYQNMIEIALFHFLDMSTQNQFQHTVHSPSLCINQYPATIPWNHEYYYSKIFPPIFVSLYVRM